MSMQAMAASEGVASREGSVLSQGVRQLSLAAQHADIAAAQAVGGRAALEQQDSLEQSTAGAASRPLLAELDAAPREIDVRDVAKRFWQGVTPEQLDYVHHLEATAAKNRRLSPNAGPSLIQRKLCSGHNRPSDALRPTLTADGTGFGDLRWNSKGELQPVLAQQFSFGLVKTVNVGPSGIPRAREPLRAVARICLFDRQHHRFYGCAASMPAVATGQKSSQWTFNPLADAVVVRCGSTQVKAGGGTCTVDPEKVSLLVELNLTYRLTLEDAAVVPQNEGKASRLVDELTICWALISLRRCAELAREMEVSIPLYMGSINEPVLLKQLYDEQRAAHPFKALFTSAKQPTLTFRAGPLPQRPVPLVAYSFMPPTMLAPRQLAYAMAAYRLALAQQLAANGGDVAAPLADAALAAFGSVLDDPAVLAVFLEEWGAQCDLLLGPQGCMATCAPGAPVERPDAAQVVAGWRRAVLAAAPLTRCSSLPPQHIGNFVEYSCHRSAVANAYAHIINPKTGKAMGPRSVVQPLSHAGAEFLHRPFDVSETRVCLADDAAAGRWL